MIAPEQIREIEQRNTEREFGHHYHSSDTRCIDDIRTLLKEVSAERSLLLAFIGSLTLADHLGDVSSEIAEVMKRADVELEWEDLEELGRKLGIIGVRTLYDTPLHEGSEGAE